MRDWDGRMQTEWDLRGRGFSISFEEEGFYFLIIVITLYDIIL